LRRAVVHVLVQADELSAGVTALRVAGHEVLVAGDGELELLVAGDDPETVRAAAGEACRAAFSDLVVGAVCFMSRGTLEDGLAIVRGFDLEPHELRFVGEEDAVLVLPRRVLREAVAAKLRTALEAGLNREVRLVEAD
jgi:hypothetical protein